MSETNTLPAGSSVEASASATAGDMLEAVLSRNGVIGVSSSAVLAYTNTAFAVSAGVNAADAALMIAAFLGAETAKLGVSVALGGERRNRRAAKACAAMLAAATAASTAGSIGYALSDGAPSRPIAAIRHDLDAEEERVPLQTWRATGSCNDIRTARERNACAEVLRLRDEWSDAEEAPERNKRRSQWWLVGLMALQLGSSAAPLLAIRRALRGGHASPAPAEDMTAEPVVIEPTPPVDPIDEEALTLFAKWFAEEVALASSGTPISEVYARYVEWCHLQSAKALPMKVFDGLMRAALALRDGSADDVSYGVKVSVTKMPLGGGWEW